MSPKPFPQQMMVFGADQPEYNPLPAHVGPEPTRVVTCFYEFTREEIAELWKRHLRDEPAGVYFSQCTFGGPLQPVSANIDFNPPTRV